MFLGCSELLTLDVSNWDISNVTNMSYMFWGCSELLTLDVSNWDISNVTDIGSMFMGCVKLTTIGPVDSASGWQHKPNKYNGMFGGCPATPKPTWYTE